MVDSLSSGAIAPSIASDPNKLKADFMYCQLLKEKFLKIRYDKSSIDEFVDYCRSQGESDSKLNDFEKTYGKYLEEESPIWWYTIECFLYRKLNLALRTLDIQALMKMNFYIRDLHEQIQQRFDRNERRIPSVVYRGQSLSPADLIILKQSIGGLYYFNCFLSTSGKRETGLSFARMGKDKSTARILFEMHIERLNSSVPFASIEDITASKNEQEILFSIGSIFRIDQIEKNEKEDVWQVELTLCKACDPLLMHLMDYLRRSLGQGNEWRQLGQLMIKMEQFQTGKEIFVQLCRHSEEPTESMFLHNQLGYCEKKLSNLQQALVHYEKVIEISRRASIPPLDARLSSTYSNIGAIWKQLKNLDEALKYFQLVLQIDQNTEKANPLEIAVDYNNIGSVLDEQGKYTEALEYYQRALEIKCVRLPSMHPSLANSYLNIGVVYRKIGNSTASLQCYEKALDIQKRSLPSNHPSLINTYSSMSILHEQLGQYSQAIQYAQEAANIAEHTLGSTHPEMIRRQEILRTLREKDRRSISTK